MTYIYAPEQVDESFGRHDDSVDMPLEMDEVRDPKSFETSNGSRVSSQKFMHANSEKFDLFNVDMQTTFENQMTPHRIEKDRSKAAGMVAEITKSQDICEKE